MKKSLFLTAVLACAYTGTMSAAGPFQTYRIVIHEDDQSAHILGVLDGVTLEGDVEIPSSVTQGGVKYTVTEIGFNYYVSQDTHHPDDADPGAPVFYNQKKITSVYIPSTITYIAPNAFLGCTAIKRFRVSSESKYYKVIDDALYSFTNDRKWLQHYPAAKEGSSYTVPDLLTAIDSWAFASAKYLTTVYIYPSSSTLCAGWSLGNYTISSIRHIADLGFAAEYKITNGMLISADGGDTVDLIAIPPAREYDLLNIPSEVTRINRLALANTRIKGITIPGSVKTIGDEAFRYSRINSVVIPSTVTEIGEGLFRDCRSLTTATLNATVTDLPYGTFEGCTSLTSAKLGASITNIFPDAYYGCSSLKSYSLAGIKSMEYMPWTGILSPAPSIFERSGLESVNWPAALTTIPPRTFYDCFDLKSVTLKEETRVIEEAAFHQTAIETFNTMNLAEIHENVLANCLNLRKLVIADSPRRLLLAKEAFWVGQFDANTQVYINHRNVGLLPNNEDDKDWGKAFYRLGDYTCYSSRLTPQYFPSDWSELYVPARVKDYYNTNFNSLGGEIYEMFSYDPDLDNKKVKITPNFSWVKITGIRFDEEAGVKSGDPTVWTTTANGIKPTEVTIDYTANGVKMTTTYTAKYNSGVSDIEFDETDTPVEYYDLQGRRVTTPTHGIYIRLQGSHREKIIL